MKKFKLGIIGAGFVGSSVEKGFNRDIEKFVVDPKLNKNSINELVNNFLPPLLFICVPTPEEDNGDVDVSVVHIILQELAELKYEGVTVIKSTITPQHLAKFQTHFTNLKIVYNPEFLTEANAHKDFLNPHMQILGGKWEDCELVEKIYIKHSSVKVVPTFKTDLATASILKYTINSFLATKVTFFNELFDLLQVSNTETEWGSFVDMLTRDPRIGASHIKVPGPDGKFGFGGHCFPKDTKALLYYANKMGVDLTVLRKAINTNNVHRKKEL